MYEQAGEWIMGYIVEMPGVNTQGRALDECRDNLQDALREFVAARREQVAAGDHTYRLADKARKDLDIPKVASMVR